MSLSGLQAPTPTQTLRKIIPPPRHRCHNGRPRLLSRPVVNVRNDVRFASASVPRRNASDYPHLRSHQRMIIRLDQSTLRESQLLFIQFDVDAFVATTTGNIFHLFEICVVPTLVYPMSLRRLRQLHRRHLHLYQ